MSGGGVPYHLRVNKAIERGLFIESLKYLNRITPIHKYKYIGFGGPFLEDYKLLHANFDIHEMVSLEADARVYERQKFNLPLGCIELRQQNSSEFIEEFDPPDNERHIIWLDYASPKDPGKQIEEFQQVLMKSGAYDIVRITVNANPAALGEAKPILLGNKCKRPGRRETDQHRLNSFKSKLGTDLIPNNILEDLTWMHRAHLPKALLAIIGRASDIVLDGTNLVAQPIISCVYADSDHQMLTATCILLPENERENHLTWAGLEDWAMARLSWHDPIHIEVPDLTAKERMDIDAKLPNNESEIIVRDANFCLGNSHDMFVKLIDNYKRFYRYYPHFSRVTL